jgi:hypothetical protein
MAKLKVLGLCLSYFMDNSNVPLYYKIKNIVYYWILANSGLA